jgi:hypothetical protein
LIMILIPPPVDEGSPVEDVGGPGGADGGGAGGADGGGAGGAAGGFVPLLVPPLVVELIE